MVSEFRKAAAAVFLFSLALILYELLLARIFAVVLFASFAHLALALALLGIGVGAICQHIRPELVPSERTTQRLGWLGLGLGLAAVLAVLATLHFPLLQIPKEAPDTYQDTSSIKSQLLRPGWFAALLPVLSMPFVFAGLVFAGAFQRYKERIGLVYAADLIGGGMGAVLFVPLLGALAGPDLVFVVLLLTGLGALVAFDTRSARGISLLVTLLAAGLCIGGFSGEVLRVRNTAGFNEAQVSFTLWTPLTRLAVFEDPDGNSEDPNPKVLVLLDNASASEIPMTVEARDRLAKQLNRSLVYKLHPPESKVAILAASAGPEVACAQRSGFVDIDAIDIAAEIFDIVADRFPNSPVNPYLQPGVRRVHMDGRAAILQTDHPYDIIQMVHANLWSAAGLLANTWSPALLETVDAFGTYLDHLTPDGTLSFGRGSDTDLLVRAAGVALQRRGIEKPWQAIAYVEGGSRVMLLKKRAWKTEELATLRSAIESYGRPTPLAWDPASENRPKSWAVLADGQVMTDDRPYVDTFKSVSGALSDVAKGRSQTPLAALYGSVLVQLCFVLLAGVFFVGLPYFLRGRSEIKAVQGGAWVLLYTAALGYGYLAVETTLVHQLVLFVGHPTYAITVVILAMLLSSGAGSAWVEGWEKTSLNGRLKLILGAIILVGGLSAWGLPPILEARALGLPLALRLGITLILLLPLGFLMGMPFPIAMRMLPSPAAGLVPWCWAINGWMSVLASLLTVLVARLYGYTDAFVVALGAYGVALLMSFFLNRVYFFQGSRP